MQPSTSLRSKDSAVFGFPSPLPTNQLPTHSNVLSLLLLYKQQLAETSHAKFEIVDFASSVATDLKALWDKASIPTILEESITRKIKAMYVEAQACERRGKPYVDKDRLFDICVLR